MPWCRPALVALLACSLGAADAAPAPAAASDDAFAVVLAAARSVNDGYQRRFESIAARLDAPDLDTRLLAMTALADLQDPKAVPLLDKRLVRDRDPREIAGACTALGRLGYPQAETGLRLMTSHPDQMVRAAALAALDQLKLVAAGDWKLRVRDDDEAIRAASTAGLTLTPEAAADALVAGLKDRSPLVRRLACVGLARLGDASHAEKIRLLLNDLDPGVRAAAGETLVRLSDRGAIPALLIALEANVASAELASCLRRLAGSDFGFDPHGPLYARQEAIERGFAWWAGQKK
jgi:HEAT repeat protein